MKNKCSLYRHFDADGALLYVGISKNAMCRLRGHKSADWYASLARMTVEHFDTRDMAASAEWRAIQMEKPLHNKIRYARKADWHEPLPDEPSWKVSPPEQMKPAGCAFIQVRLQMQRCQAILDAGGDVYALP